MVFEEAEQGKGAQGLAEEGKRDADETRVLRFQQCGQPFAEIGEKEIVAMVFRRPEQVAAVQRVGAVVLVVDEADRKLGPGADGQFHHPIEVAHRPLVAVGVAIEFRRTEGGEIVVTMAQGADRPGILRIAGLAEEEKQTLQARVQEGAGDPMVAQAARQLGDAGRRFARFGHGRGNQQHGNKSDL